MGVASGSGWNLWVCLLGVVLRRYIDFLILLIPTPLVSVLFLQQHPYFFVHLKKCFSFFIYIYILKILAIEHTKKLASLAITQLPRFLRGGVIISKVSKFPPQSSLLFE